MQNVKLRFALPHSFAKKNSGVGSCLHKYALAQFQKDKRSAAFIRGHAGAFDQFTAQTLHEGVIHEGVIHEITNIVSYDVNGHKKASRASSKYNLPHTIRDVVNECIKINSWIHCKGNVGSYTVQC